MSWAIKDLEDKWQINLHPISPYISMRPGNFSLEEEKNWTDMHVTAWIPLLISPCEKGLNLFLQLIRLQYCSFVESHKLGAAGADLCQTQQRTAQVQRFDCGISV